MTTLIKFTTLAILLHFTECTIEWYKIKLSEPTEKPVMVHKVKGGILPIKQFKRPKWV